ncbi:alpha-L-rhamnosidase C-terminal domain-containing protein [Pedobacter ginsengisoli]|uniref:alpha-L-rhamnosidase C-terminal domain-containing protein n=1 Tax=Pedobacter ginsengisoli TaxID=363852 RepID=UPI0025508CBA|nr:alpha-L-rhamnosidase C-terminal domain-containing protein [Pedobacter ginsengisoli]
MVAGDYLTINYGFTTFVIPKRVKKGLFVTNYPRIISIFLNALICCTININIMYPPFNAIAAFHTFILKKHKQFLCLLITVFCAGLLHSFSAIAQYQIYKPVTGLFTGKPVPLSPDPLVNMEWSLPKATDDLETYQLRPVSFSLSPSNSFNMESFQKSNVIIVNGKGSIRFDFGRVSAGWLEFDSDDLGDSVLMSISEYNEPAKLNIGTAHQFKTAVAIKYGKTYRLELNPLLYEGVRFGWIHVVSYKKKWHIRNVRLVCQVKPTNYRGSFSCSDPELTKIWYTGAYTVKLNLLKDYFGAILMDRSDRHSWTGDAYPAQAASMVAFGNFDFVKLNLHNTANLSNDIASYALYWVLSLVDYVNYTGDTTLANQYIENAIKKLDLAYLHFGKSPRLNFYGWDERLGAGFENPNREAQNAYSMLSIRAWKEFSELMLGMGKFNEAKKYQQYAIEKMNLVRQENNWLNTFGLHAAADAINTGLIKEDEYNFLFERNFTDRVNRISYSSFNEWFVISAMAKIGRYDEAISAIKDSWGGQIKYGGTTFFEVFRPQWNEVLKNNDAPPNNQAGYTSLTHPWSAGVVKWLSEEVLGIRPLVPGFKKFSVMPHLARSLTSVSGEVPTEYGNISASFDTQTGVGRVKIPAGTLAERLLIPLGKNSPMSLKINGKLEWKSDGTGNRDILFQATGYEDFLVLKNLKAGVYAFEIKYKRRIKQPTLQERPWIYQVNGIRQDSVTGGNWKDKYGSEGVVLFNALKNGQHIQKLPPYLNDFKLSRYKDVHTHVPTSKGLLVYNGSNKNILGAVATKDYNICEQSMTIDLPTNDKNRHRISLYFLDHENEGRRSAIEIFNMNSLDLISPMIYVRNYKEGKYVSFEFEGPIRIRINQVRGTNVTLSGLFFDKIK